MSVGGELIGILGVWLVVCLIDWLCCLLWVNYHVSCLEYWNILGSSPLHVVYIWWWYHSLSKSITCVWFLMCLNIVFLWRTKYLWPHHYYLTQMIYNHVDFIVKMISNHLWLHHIIWLEWFTIHSAITLEIYSHVPKPVLPSLFDKNFTKKVLWMCQL